MKQKNRQRLSEKAIFLKQEIMELSKNIREQAESQLPQNDDRHKQDKSISNLINAAEWTEEAEQKIDRAIINLEMYEKLKKIH